MAQHGEWYWACARDLPAGDNFVIARGKDALWARVRSEIRADEDVSWDAINRRGVATSLEDMLDLMITVVGSYGINHNRFVLEAAQIPVFAKFLRGARADLCNYVSNPAYTEQTRPVEPYSNEVMRRLGERVNQTLGIEDDWF